MVPASTWCPTRFVFSRVPFGVGNRNGHQSLANDDLELRPDQHGDMFGDGLTALVALVFLDAGATRIFIRFGLDFITMVRTRGGATFKKRRGLRSSTGGVKLKDTGACINLDHEDEEHIDGGSKMINDDTNRDKDACIEKGLKKKAITKKKKPSNIENAIPLSTVMEGKKGNKSSSSHAIVLPAKKRKLDENEGLKVKKVKANKDKNIVIHRQESAIIDSDVHMVQRGFKTRCRPFHLVEMIKTFSDDQIKAVKEIGFGGLLSLKVKRTATDMLSWLVDCFDHGSCMFTIDGKKDFVVTEFDVYDVFCLPCKTSKKVEEISRCANVINPDYDLKVKWRSHFGLMGENDQIPLGFLESKIPLLVDGGEEFRQLFIMHAFSSFLAPTSNRTVDLRIVKCLVDVNQIRIYNWSKYVLDRLCEAVKSYKEGNIEWFCGCVLMLEIIYFHRLRFRNVVLNSTIPLIQHWTDVDIRDRIRNEKLSKGFGCGILEFDTYPVSEKLQFEDGQVVCNQFKEAPVNQTSGKESVVYEGVRSNVKGVIQFELPASSMSNEEIRSIAIDEVYEKFLLMKRDLEVVSNFYMNELKVLFQTRKSNDASTSTPPMSQTDLFFMNPRVHEIVDEIVSLVNWINVVVGEVPRIGFEHVLSNGKSKCSLAMDVSLFGDKVTYVTEYMKSSNKDMKVLDAVVQELVDYCISDYHGFDLNEVLVSFGKPFEITRNEFLSLGAPAIAISSVIIDCWAMLLNENQKSSAHGPQKLYFGVSQSAFLLKVANTDSNTQDIDKLFDIWSRWLFIPCNDFDIANVELIFVPILLNEHFFLIVVNLKEEKLQFIDNMSYDTKYMSEVEKFSDVLSDMLSTFLDQRLPQSNDSVKNMIEYTLESPSVNWKSGKQKNNDSGIYTMVSMLYFDGADVFDCNVLKTVSTRRTLRAQIAATLVLSDMNIVRDEVLEKLSEFRLIRSQVAKDVFDGIKKKTKQGKKEKKV
uniref:Ubiquitin-like protease family profile domain-containing protein n=1 Tax=Chenopodium quinoa TaxID=63459 RepID=A0A803MVF8_CHEQI